jgi:predicted transcriptional regulator
VIRRAKRSADPGIEAMLGPLGGRIMRIVLDQGPVTVRDVFDAVTAGANQPAYTTVMTVMARLHERGLIERVQRGRGFVYNAAADEQATIDELSRRAVDQVLRTYGNAALRGFAVRLSELDPTDREALIDLAQSERDAT